MLCVPIQAESVQKLKIKALKAARVADFVEIWIDHLPPGTSAKEMVAVCPKPLIIVNKPRREKGKWKGTEKSRIERLREFAIPGVAYIDVGMDTDKKLIKELVKTKKRSKVILSYHNFERTPSESELKQKIKKGFALGADVVKIATFAKTPKDNLTVLSLLKTSQPLAVMCMGRHGKISRMVGEALGSQFTFAALDAASRTAPGQMIIDEYETIASLLKKS